MVGMLSGCTVTQSSLPYPSLYEEAQLPQYEYAWVTNNGKVKDSLDHGIKLRLRSKKPVDTIKEYYHNALTSSGWSQRENAFSDIEGFYGVGYEKENMVYEITIEKQTKDTSISIIYKTKEAQ